MNVPFRTRSRSFEVVFSMSRWNHQTDPCNQSIQCVLLRHMTMYERVYFDGFRSFSPTLFDRFSRSLDRFSIVTCQRERSDVKSESALLSINQTPIAGGKKNEKKT